jgi:hypothetical protein
MAYRADDDKALVDAYNAINGSLYSQMLGYTQAQQERLNQARNRISAASPPFIPGVVSPTQLRQPQPLSLPSVPQPVPGNNEPFAAKVKGQIITLDQLEWACQLKGPYTKYRISCLRQQINQSDHTSKQASIPSLKVIKTEKEELEKISSDLDRLREATLEDLVGDVLIREEIDQQIGQNQTNNKKFDAEARDLLTILIESYNYRHPSQDANEQTLNVLCIFCRYKWFADYLYRKQNVLLKEWLKQCRKREEKNIDINYNLARIKSPKSSVLSNVLRMMPGASSGNLGGIIPITKG